MKSQTPVLMVEDVAATINFYVETLGFTCVLTVPENTDAPVFAIVKNGDIDIMLQNRVSMTEELPFFARQPLGGTFTLYISVDNIQKLYDSLKNKVTLTQDLHDTFYGATEFSILDCNGYVLAFAEQKSIS